MSGSNGNSGNRPTADKRSGPVSKAERKEKHAKRKDRVPAYQREG